MAERPILADWIAVDWGTTHLRAWAMQGTSAIDHARSDAGMSSLSQEAFEPALLELVAPWLGQGRTEVIACGMVGSRQGWVEAPYRSVPARPLVPGGVLAPVQDPRLLVRVLPGLKQMSPPDVMRGEESQIAGFQALNPGWDGVICLPGTHTKWVHMSAGEVVSFQTFMTGELFATLGAHSVLRHSLSTEGWDDEAFSEALSETLSRPERLAAALFSLRAGDLLLQQSGETARARLSGLLIGAELAAARPYWLGQQIAIVGASETAGLYAAALESQGLNATVADGERMTLAGLSAAYRQAREAA